MIGELLAHVIFVHYGNNMKSVNPFFNMEENNIKKGFDLIFFDTELRKIWITEVKSGNTNKQTSEEKNRILLNRAKTDLITRLNSDEDSVWHNAINGAMLTMLAAGSKKNVLDLLNKNLADVMAEKIVSADKHVIMVSVLFNNLSDKIHHDDVEDFNNQTISEEHFTDIITLSIQKETFQAVEDFLKSEVV